MKLSLLTRKLHSWTLTLLALPLLVMCLTGVVLHLKKAIAWVQPTEQRGSAAVPTLEIGRVLEICRTRPELQVASWRDIKRVDLRPSSGVIKVLTANSWEAQIDAGNGRVLSLAERRSDLLEAMHDGSWFHPLVKTWLFLPSGVLLGAGVVTGIYLFFLPMLNQRRATRRSRARLSGAAAPAASSPEPGHTATQLR